MVAAQLAGVTCGGPTFMINDCFGSGSKESSPESICQFNNVMMQVSGS